MPAALAFVPAWAWRWLAIIGVALAFGAYCAFKMHQHDQIAYNELAEEFGKFKVEVKALGEQAEKGRLTKIAADKRKKDKADAEISAALATLAGTIAGLRRDRPSGGLLPPGPASPGGADVACFDRPAIERAYGTLIVGLRGLGDEGAKATVNLDTAKRWAQQK